MTGKVGFVEARDQIRRELNAHIQEGIESAVRNGDERGKATAKVLEKMGDPVQLGAEFDRIHAPGMDFLLPVLTALLCGCGLYALRDSGRVGIQALWMGIGSLLALGAFVLSPRQLRLTLAALYPVAVLGLLTAQFSGFSFAGEPYLNLFGLAIKITDAAAWLMALSLPALGETWKFQRAACESMAVLILGPVAALAHLGSVWPSCLLTAAGITCMAHMGFQRAAGWVGTLGVILIFGINSSFATSAGPLSAVEGQTDFILFSLLGDSRTMGLLAVAGLSALALHSRLSLNSMKKNWLKATASVCSMLLSLEILVGVAANYGIVPMFKSGLYLPFLSFGGSLTVLHLLVVGIWLACFKRRTISYFSLVS